MLSTTSPLPRDSLILDRPPFSRPSITSLTNYVSYLDVQTQLPRVGHYNLEDQTIQPLSFISGTPISDLYQVIEAGASNIASSSSSSLLAKNVRILPPFPKRDVLCVGKNYAEHAKEFNRSGFDKSDNMDQPSHPVIFTKRLTSIIADGEEISPQPEFTSTLDYEGELGVIIGKAGFRIEERDAMEHVWGYTIINDVTARERQRDHKQFYIGKSADTFCPMGPIAVPASKLEKVLRVQTHVNGEIRQDATTNDLIFSIPYLIKVMSEGQTLAPGDVLATGTPAGVGIGRSPPVYLKPGDTVSISISGLGTLTNRVAGHDAPNPTPQKVKETSSIQLTNNERLPGLSLLPIINKKPLYCKCLPKQDETAASSHIVFIHGLGATNEYYAPLIHAMRLDSSHTCHLWDLEGQGLSPTHPLSRINIATCTDDLFGIFQLGNIDNSATIVAHSIGCVIALFFALRYPERVSKLILLSPPSSPLPMQVGQDWHIQATTARTRGMPAVADGIVSSASPGSEGHTMAPLAAAALRMMLCSLHPEGFAKACGALVETMYEGLEIADIRAKTLIIVGDKDQVFSPQMADQHVRALGRVNEVRLVTLEGVGHWHVFEDTDGVARAIEEFLG
ncbi:unnamed protein product [Periconia digitata]|uniref:Fumarylacetoacetate hydrolase-like protein n=1 Tax=Periconia digitata TaxID=1303443 RepID=A0A9W4XDN7_9PLEO|nr:unnamed protein product [Periconia digitata]